MTDETGLEAAVAAYIAFYEELTPDSLQKLDRLCAPTIRFRDPFNEVTGVPSYRAILAQMFQDVDEPRFTVIDWALSGRVAYLRWDFTFKRRQRGAPWHLEGMSEVHFDQQALVTAHLDHWDSGAQFYGRLPVLRHVIAKIRKRLSVKP